MERKTHINNAAHFSLSLIRRRDKQRSGLVYLSRMHIEIESAAID
jgi:hypothetical protein